MIPTRYERSDHPYPEYEGSEPQGSSAWVAFAIVLTAVIAAIVLLSAPGGSESEAPLTPTTAAQLDEPAG